MTALHPGKEHYVVTTLELVRNEVRVLAASREEANAQALAGDGLITRLPQTIATTVVDKDEEV